MADEPMSDEQLAVIYDFMANREQDLLKQPVANTIYVVHVRQLLTEIKRLRAREAAAMAIVRDVADTMRRYTDGTHDWALVSEDLTEQARALLAQEETE